VLRQLPDWRLTITRFTPTARSATVRPASSSPDQSQRACPGIKGQQQPPVHRVAQRKGHQPAPGFLGEIAIAESGEKRANLMAIQIDPYEMEECALIDGATAFRS
jgi:hypothetical protein